MIERNYMLSLNVVLGFKTLSNSCTWSIIVIIIRETWACILEQICKGCMYIVNLVFKMCMLVCVHTFCCVDVRYRKVHRVPTD